MTRPKQNELKEATAELSDNLMWISHCESVFWLIKYTMYRLAQLQKAKFLYWMQHVLFYSYPCLCQLMAMYYLLTLTMWKWNNSIIFCSLFFMHGQRIADGRSQVCFWCKLSIAAAHLWMNGVDMFKERDLSLVTCYATWTHLCIMWFSVARTFHTLICCMPAAIYRQDIFKQCVSDLYGYKHFMYSDSILEGCWRMCRL